MFLSSEYTLPANLRRNQIRPLLLSLIAVGLLWSLPSQAQSAAAKGSISGTVTDPQGNAVPGAQITIRNTDFGSVRSLVADDNGSFSTAMLIPGAYTVEVKASGFSLKKPARVTVGVGGSVQLTIWLGLPPVSQSVTVTAHGPTLEGNTLPPAINQQAPEVSNALAGLTVTIYPTVTATSANLASWRPAFKPLPLQLGWWWMASAPTH